MNKEISRKPGRKIFLSALLIHALCIFMAAHLDLFRRSEYSFARASNINYWFWISTWWCVWTAWLTIIWSIYKLTKRNEGKNSYFEQIFDLTVVIANFLMFVNLIIGLVVYFGSNKRVAWIYAPDMDNPSRTIKLFNSWEVRTQTYFWFNTIISHTFPALLIIYYFFKFAKVDLLEEKLKLVIGCSLVNPMVYFLFVILREKFSNFFLHPGKLSYDFPRNYPMGFFYRCMGQQAHEGDVNFPHSLTSRFFWTIGTVTIGCLIFSFLVYFFIKLKTKVDKNFIKIYTARL